MKYNYYKHKTLDFVINVTEEYTIQIGEEWIRCFHEPLRCLKGIVVYDPNDIWGTGKESVHWSTEAFEKMQSKYIVDINNEDVKYWNVTDIQTGEEYTGGWYETGSFKNRDYRIIIEWDSEVPENYEEIEDLITELI